VLNDQSHLPTQDDLSVSTIDPLYYGGQASESLAEHAVNPNLERPPYQASSFQSHLRQDQFVNQNGYHNSEPCHYRPTNQTTLFLSHITQQTHTPTSTLMGQPQLKRRHVQGSGGRSAIDRKNKLKLTHSQKISENSSTQPIPRSANPPITPLISKALAELYPQCRTFGSRLNSLFQDYSLYMDLLKTR
jgi:hypothetical protein